MPARRRREASDGESEDQSRPTQSQSRRGRASGKVQQRGARGADSDGEEAGATQGSRKGKDKKGKGAQSALDHQELAERAADLTRYAVLNEWRRKPLKRDDAGKMVLGANSRQFVAALRVANEQLQQVFGMELIEMRPKGCNPGQLAAEEEQARREKARRARRNEEEEDTQSKKKVAGPKSYVLRSVLEPQWISAAVAAVDKVIPQNEVEDDDGNPVQTWLQDDGAVLDWRRGDELGQQAILGVVLALILANGRVIDDQQLRSHLRRLGVRGVFVPPHTPASHNPPKGVSQLLASWTRAGYLEEDRSHSIGGGGGSTQSQRRQSQRGSQREEDLGDSGKEWRWGARAEIEFGETAIAELMAELYLETSPNGPPAGGAAGKTPKEKIVTDIERAAGSKLQDAADLEPVY